MKDTDNRIYEYMDNCLDSEAEQDLFREMAYNDELKSDFQAVEKINGAIGAFKNQAVPPASLTLSVLSATKHIPKAAADFGTLAYLKAHAITIAASLVGACFAIAMLSSNNSEQIETNKVNIPKPFVVPITKSEAVADAESVYNTKSIPGEKIKAMPFGRISSTRSIAEPKVQAATADEETNFAMPFIYFTETKPEEEHKPAIRIYETKPMQTNIDFSRIATEGKLVNIPQQFDIMENTIWDNLSLEIGYSFNKDFEAANINQSKQSWTNNSQLSLLCTVTDDLQIGANIRQETFVNKYTQTDTLGRIYNVEMQPSITSGGITFRYNLLEYGPVRLEPQANLSLNKYGWIARPGLTLKCELMQSIEINAIGEYSIFTYQRQNKTFNSQKLSLSFGIGYKL